MPDEVGSSGDGAARLRSVRDAWESATVGGGAACGLPVAVAAFERLREAWSAELGAHLAVLEQLAGEETADEL